jgi:hypothetical protein
MIARIRELYWAKPFRPFTLHLADGESVTVSHPELMALSANTKEAYVMDPDGAGHWVNLPQITKITVKSKKTNSAN